MKGRTVRTWRTWRNLAVHLSGLLCLHACTFYNEAPPDSRIDAYFDSVERCLIDPTDVACCSRSSATLASGIARDGSSTHITDWTERDFVPPELPLPTPDADAHSWISQHSLLITRGAALELNVRREARAEECDTSDAWQATEEDYAAIEIIGQHPDPTSTWISYGANGRLVASLAGERYDECQRESRLRVQVDLRPGVVDREDVMLGSLGIVSAESDDPRDVQWLERDVSLGPVRAFTEGQQVRLSVRGDWVSPADVWQYQGTCTSASVFEPLQEPFEPNELGADAWANTLGEAALAIAPAIETPQESWELLFSGERSVEVGVTRRRAIGYSKRFGDGDAWVSVPSPDTPLLGASGANALTLDADYREPSLALSEPGERAIAYTAGRGATHLEVGRLIEGEVRDVQVIDPECTRGACAGLAQPALVKQADGYLLYFTCCPDLAYECGSGVGDDALWLARLDDELRLSARKDARPRRVDYDRAGVSLLQAGQHIVSAEPIALDDEVRIWLVVQDELQNRAVLLARSGHHPYEFSFHTTAPVLTAADLCPGEPCLLESLSVARVPGEDSVKLLALVSHVAEAEPRQTLHLLSQRLEVPW